MHVAILGVVGRKKEIGKIARKVLGKHFHIIGSLYRSVFVDLYVVSQSISPYIFRGSIIVDVGGGDGELLNSLLSLRPDIKVKMIDRSKCIGGSLKEEFSSRVELFPGIGMDRFTNVEHHKFDVVLISDVVHHISDEERGEFFSDLRKMVGDKNGIRIIIKDIEPGYYRASLSRIADRYISGDKNVSLIGSRDISRMVLEAFGESLTVERTDLFSRDKPNFAIVFSRKQA